MKTEYQFKPADHWNYVSEMVYNVLKNFYSIAMLQVIVTKE